MTRRHLTASGRFEVVRQNDDPGFELRHVASGLRCGSFSHIAVRTFKAAVEGVEEAEARLTATQLETIDRTSDASPARHTALANFAWSLRQSFPDGAWSR